MQSTSELGLDGDRPGRFLDAGLKSIDRGASWEFDPGMTR